MLVISRRLDEAVRIGHDILVRVVEVDGQKIRLGIEAPEDIAVRRIEPTDLDCEAVLVMCTPIADGGSGGA